MDDAGGPRAVLSCVVSSWSVGDATCIFYGDPARACVGVETYTVQEARAGCSESVALALQDYTVSAYSGYGEFLCPNTGVLFVVHNDEAIMWHHRCRLALDEWIDEGDAIDDELGGWCVMRLL